MPASHNDILFKLSPLLHGLRDYHDHRLIGAENLPSDGPAIVAVNHSLASYDIALMMTAIYDETKRIPRSLVDRLFFKVPGVGPLMEKLGSVEGSHRNALKLLQNNEIIVIAPGGMRESLRPTKERYQIIWERRKGFVKLSIETGTPIVLGACPHADNIYDVVPSHLTVWAYKTFKIPLFLAKGVGLTPIPKRVKLTHVLSEPLHPPARTEDEREFSRQVDEFHQIVCERMKRLMAEALTHG